VRAYDTARELSGFPEKKGESCMKHMKRISIVKPQRAQSTNFRAKLNFALGAIDNGTSYFTNKRWDGRL